MWSQQAIPDYEVTPISVTHEGGGRGRESLRQSRSALGWRGRLCGRRDEVRPGGRRSEPENTASPIIIGRARTQRLPVSLCLHRPTYPKLSLNDVAEGGLGDGLALQVGVPRTETRVILSHGDGEGDPDLRVNAPYLERLLGSGQELNLWS